MPNGDRPTVDQHTVPQVHLRKFSDDNERIRFYDFEKKQYSKGRVKIGDLCYKKNMYEFYDDDGNIDSVNIIEDYLKKYEDLYNGFCSKFEAMMKPIETSCSSGIVSEDDVAFWTAFAVIQHLRTNKTISALQDRLGKDKPDESKRHLRNKVLYNCLPLFMHGEDRKNYAFDRVIEWFSEMDFSVLLSPKYEFITSDNPVCGISDDRFNIHRFIFPISRNIALQFIDMTDANYINKTTVTTLTKGFVDSANFSLGVKAERQIYFENIDEKLLDKIIAERNKL